MTGASPLNATTEMYAFGGAAYKDNVASDNLFRRPLDSGTVRAIFPDGFLPRIRSGIGDASGLVGLRGSLSGLRWDVSSGIGGNRVAYHVANTNNVSLGPRVLPHSTPAVLLLSNGQRTLMYRAT
jgi:hypothetical protein